MSISTDRQKQILRIIPYVILVALSQYEVNYNAWQTFSNKSTTGRRRREKTRILWSTVCKCIIDKQFRRMFRMTRACFQQLCAKIIMQIGESNFKSESYIDDFLMNKNRMFMAHQKTSGGYISGETKLTITLRLLAGGDACDLGILFDVSFKHCNKIMYLVLSKWINKTKIGGIDMYKYLDDDAAMQKVSNGFSKRSDGLFQGSIGALDCWLVRIVCPSYWRDGYKNITGFFSEKVCMF